jgi:fatty-acyl-CoA synthase
VTLSARLEHGAGNGGAVTFVGSAAGSSNGTRPDTSAIDRVEWSRLHDDAIAMAAALQRRGVGPGMHVGVLGPTTRPLVTALQAIWLSGATVVALPLPMRLGSIDEFVAQTRRRVDDADAQLVLVDPGLASLLDVPDGVTALAFDRLVVEARAGHIGFVRAPDDPDRVAILQFTSGSTADPKGVVLPDRCIIANVDAIVEAAAITADDRAVSWLPLYHDMGLIGLLLTPMLNGIDLVLGAPQDFLAAPAVWLEWISEFRGTVTAGPNFSYALATRALRRDRRFDLSSWRLALNGAEPVDPGAVEAFCAAGAPHGLDETTAFPVFGMAEATLGVTFPELGVGLDVDTVDLDQLERDGVAAPVEGAHQHARRFAVLGRPLRDFELRIVDARDGTAIPDRHVGELVLRGPSVSPGYYRNPAATAAAFADGWLHTGDLAYLVDGRLVVCGRLKDVIIVGGRNVYPEDVERAAAEVDGVRAGNVIAFSTDVRGRGRESIVVVAEARDGDIAGGSGTIRAQVIARVRDAVGVPPADVVLVQPGVLPKTSSGKLQRSRCRDRYRNDQLEPL